MEYETQAAAKQPSRTRAGALIAVTLLAALAAGCAQGGGDGSGTPAGGKAAGGGLTQGPMAQDDGPMDTAAAARGEQLFAAKGCSACHGFGRRVTGPDLAGVTTRRTRAWMERMIQHPDLMTKEDETARGLLGTYAVQMPNLQLQDAQVDDLVEFLRAKNGPQVAGKE